MENHRLVHSHCHEAGFRNEEAEYGFELLKTNAACAVPALIKIYQAGITPSSQRCAAMALGHIGPAAKAALPVFLKNFTYTNDEVRARAVGVVCDIRSEPSQTIPALRSVLKDPNIFIRRAAANGLGMFGMFGYNARAAVPELLEALQEPATKEGAEIALWRIAPEKISNPLLVEDATPMVAGGVTTESIRYLYRGKRGTYVPAGRAVPCVTQFFNSQPRGLKRY